MLGIGFESGGSRTTYALASDGDATWLGGSEVGASIADARDADAMAVAVDWIMDVVDSKQDDEMCVWIAAAGFSASTAQMIRSRFEPRLRALRRQADEDDRRLEIFIANDAVALLKAPPLNGAGLAAIVGTGSVVLGTHPSAPDGVVKRGGYEWLVSDEGAGVWMTLQSIRLILKDIEERGPRDYHSALLDRMTEYFGIAESDLGDIPASHRSLAKADAVARKMAESRTDMKRFFARFAYPHLFDLATLETGKSHDRIAADVLDQSVQQVVDSVRVVSETLAAYTADQPNLRESLPLLVAGSIAANPMYDQRLRGRISAECRYISSVEAVSSSSQALADLGLMYLRSGDREKRRIARSFDPLHPVLKLL